MRTRSEVLRQLADSWQCSGDDYTAQVHRDLADLLEAAEPRPWPPPAGVTRCLGWDKEREKWRVCIHEYGSWVFEDDNGFAKRWCAVWLSMPPEPECAR